MTTKIKDKIRIGMNEDDKYDVDGLPNGEWANPQEFRFTSTMNNSDFVDAMQHSFPISLADHHEKEYSLDYNNDERFNPLNNDIRYIDFKKYRNTDARFCNDLEFIMGKCCAVCTRYDFCGVKKSVSHHDKHHLVCDSFIGRIRSIDMINTIQFNNHGYDLDIISTKKVITEESFTEIWEVNSLPVPLEMRKVLDLIEKSKDIESLRESLKSLMVEKRVKVSDDHQIFL